jgi:hypothetical protein
LGIDAPTDIVAGFDNPLYSVQADNMYKLLLAVRKATGVVECYPFGEAHHLIVDAEFDIGQFKAELADVQGLCIKPAEPTIEDMFIKLMKQ